MKAKALTLTGLCALIAALAVAAGGAAAGPPTVQPFHFDTTYATSACGMDNLVETDSGSGVFRIDASGTASFAGLGLELTLTNPANGKTIRLLETGTDSFSALIPNGDGTFTAHVTLSGMFKYSTVPGGPLKIGTGHVDFVLVFDSSLNMISSQVLHSGGSTPDTNFDPCPLIVSALT
jgi:hypothetical protein